jgi:hypothetical protein
MERLRMTRQDQASADCAAPPIVSLFHRHVPTPNGCGAAVIPAFAPRPDDISRLGGQDRTGALSPDVEAPVRQARAPLEAMLDAPGARADRGARLARGRARPRHVEARRAGRGRHETARRNAPRADAGGLASKLAIAPMLLVVEADARLAWESGPRARAIQSVARGAPRRSALASCAAGEDSRKIRGKFALVRARAGCPRCVRRGIQMPTGEGEIP